MSCMNRNDLHKYFPLPSTSFQTTGMQDGTVIRFKTFYLKIYDDKYKYGYIVKGYRYTQINPVFEQNVSVSKFKKFASQFNREDYLSKFQKFCHNPNCIFR